MLYMARVVRPAVASDGSRIVEVQTAAWQTAYEGILPSDRLAVLSDSDRHARSTRLWARRATDQGRTSALLVGDVGGVVAGFAAASESQERDLGRSVCQLDVLHVHPDQWGSGLARELLGATEDWMREAGFERGVLWTVRDAGRARRFYEREGWVHDGRTRIELEKPLWRDLDIPQVRYVTAWSA